MIEASIQVGGEHFAELVDDGLVRVRLVQTEDCFEADRLEIALLLRLFLAGRCK